jgi:hypothetical protein
MTEQTPGTAVLDSQSKEVTRRAYLPPQLIVHGTVQTITQEGGTGGGDASSVDGG